MRNIVPSLIYECEIMILILLNWLYVFIMNLCLGLGFSVACNKLFGYRFKGMDSLLIAGLAISTVYAQIFSLFTGVGKVANIILFVLCVLILLLCRKEVKEYFEAAPGEKRSCTYCDRGSVGTSLVLFYIQRIYAL